jgi:hypothetical protein
MKNSYLCIILSFPHAHQLCEGPAKPYKNQSLLTAQELHKLLTFLL